MADRTTLNSLVPLAHVRSVPTSIEFYTMLGFTVENTHTPEGGAEPVWAWLVAGGAHLMIARTRAPIEADEPRVLFYLYTNDVGAFRAQVVAAGVECGVVEYPFWAPRGEFRVVDPDGYVLMVTHT